MPPTEYTTVEAKLCELCGRGFTREVGSAERECKRHRRATRLPVEREFPGELTFEGGRKMLRLARVYLHKGLVEEIKNGSAFDARALALASACELLDKVIGTKAYD